MSKNCGYKDDTTFLHLGDTTLLHSTRGEKIIKSGNMPQTPPFLPPPPPFPKNNFKHIDNYIRYFAKFASCYSGIG